MKISELKMLIKAAYATPNKQPIFAWGSPGVGKSQAVEQAGEEIAKEQSIKGFKVVDRRLGIMDITDLMGFPMVEKGELRMALPDWLPRSGCGILFLDELVQASPAIQAAASQLILDRRIGGYTLPSGWMVMAAGNRKTDRAATFAMPAHIANRFVHANVEVSVDEWIAWALAAGIDIRIIAFIKWRPNLLSTFATGLQGEAFGSPRSYAFASALLQTAPPKILMETMRGCIGEGNATELVGFLSVYEKMPDIDALILNPKQAPLITDPATLSAVTSALVHRASKDNLGRVAAYFGRLVDAKRPDFAVKALKEVAARHPGLTQTRAYVEWSSQMSSYTA